MDKTYRLGTCTWCGDKGEVYRDNGRCEDCDSDVFHCAICKQDYHRDSHCRHIFQDDDFEWTGSGAYAPSPAIKDSFFELLTLMPEGFASDLRIAIKSGKFYTWIVAPLIGSGGHLSLYGMPERGGHLMLNDPYGDAMLDLGGGPHAEDTADGYHWLASLYERKTRKANKITIDWIDQWLCARVPLAGVWFRHSPAPPTVESCR